MNPWGVVLAAGAGVRFGRGGGGNKLLADLDGRPLVARPLELTSHAVRERLLAGAVVVTSGPDSPVAILADHLGVRPVPNPDRNRGIGSSVQAGLAALPADADAALFLLGDEPFVTIEAIRAVIDGWLSSGAPLIRASHDGTPCHPVLVARTLWPRARELQRDEGFRALTDLSPVLVPVESPDHHGDMDTPDDLVRARGSDA